MYCLFDASVVAAYYCPITTRSKKAVEIARNIIESVRSGERNHFFYIPNFCIAEVFNVFMKYTYSNWNRHTRQGRLNRKVHNSVRKQFQKDIHNASLFYHYELSRYHVLAINLVSPIDHYYKLARSVKRGSRHNPAGTLDQLIITMGIHLARIHGSENVVVITTDERICKIIEKCRSPIGLSARNHLKLREASEFTGIPFRAASFPRVINLKNATKQQLRDVFGEWPLPVKQRYKKPYLA
jgi:hypothetical protein